MKCWTGHIDTFDGEERVFLVAAETEEEGLEIVKNENEGLGEFGVDWDIIPAGFPVEFTGYFARRGSHYG